MEGISKLNKELERILCSPENKKDNRIRVWGTRYYDGKLSLDKKIQIVEEFGDKKVLITLK